VAGTIWQDGIKIQIAVFMGAAFSLGTKQVNPIAGHRLVNYVDDGGNFIV
jgi:hypothetical protein